MTAWTRFAEALESDNFAQAKTLLKKITPRTGDAGDLSLPLNSGRSALIHVLIRIRSRRIKSWRYGGQSAINRVEYRIENGLFSLNKNGHREAFPLSQQRLCASQSWGPGAQLIYYDAIDCALALIAKGTDFELTDEEGNTPLLLACVCGEVRLIRALVKAGADTKAVNNAGENILHLSAASERADALAAVLKLETCPGINDTDKAGWTALHHVCASGDYPAMLKSLLKYGANKDVRGRAPKKRFSAKCSALDIAKACEAKQSERLLSPKKGPARSRFDVRAVLAGGDILAVGKYLDRGGDVEAADSEGYTLLLSAVSANNIALVSLLLERGADINAVQNQNFNALLLSLGNLAEAIRRGGGEYDAGCKGIVRIAELLIEQGVDLTAVKRISGQSALHDAAAVSSHLTRLIVSRIVHEYDDPAPLLDCADSEGLRPLHMAARNGNTAAVDILVRAGAGPNCADNSGFLALHEALFAKKRDAAVVLLDAGSDTAFAIRADRFPCRNGDTARTIAEKLKLWDIVKRIDDACKK